MSVSESRPFALDFFSQVDGANGLGRDAAQSEFVDNAKDAESSFHWTAVTSVDPETNTYFMIGLDHGTGLYELPQLFGLGEQTLKKSEGKLGLKNTGHMAAIAAFKPDAVHYYSQASCMSFKIKEFSQAYKAEMSAEGGRDYRKGSLNPTKYMRFNDSPTENDAAILSKAIASVKTPGLRSLLENIRSKLTPTYLLQIMVFSNDQNAALAKELWDATNTFRFYYAKALQNGFQIHLEMPSGDAKHLVGENTISPLGSDAFQRLRFECEVRRANKRILMEVTMSTDPGTEVAPQFWVSGTTSADLTLQKPMSWDSGKSLGNFTIQTTCLSQAEQLEQTRQLMPYTVDNLRGVYCEFMDRILGLPFWDGQNYGAAKNAGGVRAVITFEQHAIAEKLLAISSHKHKTNLKESHPVMKNFIKKVVHLVVDNYSYTGLNTAGKGQNPGVATWDLNKCYRQMLGLPEPVVIDDGGESSGEEDASSDDSTDTEDDDDSVPPPPPDSPQPAPPAPAPPAPAPPYRLPLLGISSTATHIRLELNDTFITFPHDSKFLSFSDIIKSKYMTLGAEQGLAYIKELAELQLRYA
jgi:hypothetical protein